MAEIRSGEAKRLLGLDCLRAAAIVLVVLAHGARFPGNPLAVFSSTSATTGWTAGITGVEIFYCLSGFLIGTILLELERDGMKWPETRTFLIRRWMRTLPLYYLVLVALILLKPLDPVTRPPLLPFFLLSQNILSPMAPENWFGTSWSLVIEEWSYLLLPALAFVVLRRAPQPVLSAALVLCAAGLTARLWQMNSGEPWDATVRKVFVMRADALSYGVMLAWLRDRYGSLLTRYAFYLLPLSGALLFYAITRLSDETSLNGLFGRVLALPAFAISICAVMPVVLCLDLPEAGARVIRFVAKTSYAVYLVHWSVMRLALSLPGPLRFAGYIVATYSAATFLTYAVEQPMMRRRPRQMLNSGRRVPANSESLELAQRQPAIAGGQPA